MQGLKWMQPLCAESTSHLQSPLDGQAVAQLWISISHQWERKSLLEGRGAAPLSEDLREHPTRTHQRALLGKTKQTDVEKKKSKQNSWPWNSPFPLLLAVSPISHDCHCHQVYAAFKEQSMPNAPRCCRATGRPRCWFGLGRTKSDFSSDVVGPC